MNSVNKLSSGLSKTGFIISQFCRYFIYNDEYAVSKVQACEKAIEQDNFNEFLENLELGNPYHKKEEALIYLISSRIKRQEEGKYEKTENKLLNFLKTKYSFKKLNETHKLLLYSIEQGNTQVFEYLINTDKYNKNNVDFSSLLVASAQHECKDIFNFILELVFKSPSDKLIGFDFKSKNLGHAYYVQAYEIMKSKKELEKTIKSNSLNSKKHKI